MEMIRGLQGMTAKVKLRETGYEKGDLLQSSLP